MAMVLRLTSTLIVWATICSSWAHSHWKYNVTMDGDVCEKHSSCSTCMKEANCGWFEDAQKCVFGKGSGCGSSEKTSDNDGWLTFGGDYQHSGYVSYYNNKIDSSYSANVYLTINISNTSYDYVSSVAVKDNVLYFSDYNINTNTTAVNAYSIDSRKELWRVQLQYQYYDGWWNYLSGPSISSDGNNIVAIAAATTLGLITPIALTDDPIWSHQDSYAYYYTASDTAWSIIPPAIATNHDGTTYVYFQSSSLDIGIQSTFSLVGYFDAPWVDNVQSNEFMGDCAISSNPAYFNDSGYYHVGDHIYRVGTHKRDVETLFASSKILYNNDNLNSTIAISTKTNILFVSGYYLCAIEMSTGNNLWCVLMEGGSSQGVTPAIDENDHNYVYIYDNGYIKGYNQFTGQCDYTYGDGTLNNICNLEYGCQSSQPIVTKYNIIWADGTSVFVFDKITQDQDPVLAIFYVCGTYSNYWGNSIALYDKYIIVSCKDKIVMYQLSS